MNIIWTVMKTVWLFGVGLMIGKVIDKAITKGIVAHRIKASLKDRCIEDQLDINIYTREIDDYEETIAESVEPLRNLTPEEITAHRKEMRIRIRLGS